MKRGTGFKPQAPIKEKLQPFGSEAQFPTLKLHIPSLNPELNPKLCAQSVPFSLSASPPLRAIVCTPADAMSTADIIAIVALQAFMVVAGPSIMAVLVELGGAHLAAAAAIRD